MAKNILIFTIPLSIVVALILIWNLLVYLPPSNSIKLKISDTTYTIELATTTAQKVKGLSGRDELCSKCGMLFIFNNETSLPFWMKDTRIPLDMIWLNKEGKVVDIQTALDTNSIKTYQNKSPAKYVLELNANDSQKINLKIGDVIDLSKIND